MRWNTLVALNKSQTGVGDVEHAVQHPFIYILYIYIFPSKVQTGFEINILVRTIIATQTIHPVDVEIRLRAFHQKWNWCERLVCSGFKKKQTNKHRTLTIRFVQRQQATTIKLIRCTIPKQINRRRCKAMSVKYVNAQTARRIKLRFATRSMPFVSAYYTNKNISNNKTGRK